MKKLLERIAKVINRSLERRTRYDESDASPHAVSPSEEEFVNAFCSKVPKYLGVCLAALLIVGILDFSSCGGVSNQIYGLSLDLIGAIVLGIGLVKSTTAIAVMGSTGWDINKAVIRNLAEDSVNGIIGVTLLIVGVILQFLAVSGVYLVNISTTGLCF